MERYQRISRAFKQAPWRSQLQTAAAGLLVVIAAAAIGGLYLIGTSRWATTGREVQDLQMKVTELRIQNGELRAQLALLQSVGRLEARAAELGYLPASNEQIEYLVIEGYPGHAAARSSSVAESQPEVAAAEANPPRYDETLLDWLWRRLSGPASPTERSNGSN